MKKRTKRNVRIFSKNTDDEISSLAATPSPREAGVKPAGSFCSLVKSFCKSEKCMTCSALDNHVPNKIWLCSTCVDTERYVLYPFWEDVECSICGINVGVMVCAKARKYKR